MATSAKPCESPCDSSEVCPSGRANSIDSAALDHGDIGGNRAPQPGDVSVMIMKLNGVLPAGNDDRAFDLDANGAAEPGDVQYLMNILNGQPVP